MDKKEILEFITKNPIAYMATIDGDKPRVRAMGTYRADENGIIFSMQSPKDVYKQLVKNPETEICYWAEGTQIRVSGRMEEIKDTKMKEEIVEARPFYKPGVEEQGLDYAGVFILKKGKAYVVDQKATPGSPKTYVDL
ncbi:pyridoxamine 5'-phosphate oxidase family protein [Chloroflexota bacterium]